MAEQKMIILEINKIKNGLARQETDLDELMAKYKNL